MAEQADARDLKSLGSNTMWVRFPPAAPCQVSIKVLSLTKLSSDRREEGAIPSLGFIYSYSLMVKTRVAY